MSQTPLRGGGIPVSYLDPGSKIPVCKENTDDQVNNLGGTLGGACVRYQGLKTLNKAWHLWT